MPATLVAALDDSAAALRAARLLGGYQGDRSALKVVALNVQARPVTLWPGPPFDPGALDAALLREGERQLGAACKLLTEAALQVEPAVRVGIPAALIPDEAIRRGAAAIVMGTRGDGALGGYALGSVSLRVAHRAQAPVLLVHPEARLPPALGKELRVLVPLDGSAHATRALSELLHGAAWLGALDIDLLYVRPAPGLWGQLRPEQRRLLDEWGTQESEQATREARAQLYLARVGHRLHESAGEPSREIVRSARRLDSELIVMGTRGLGAVHHALIGSTALKVAHASPVPVVLVA